MPKFTPGSNERSGSERGSKAYQVMKRPATGTGRDAINAAPSKEKQRAVSRQGSVGRPPQIFGVAARGLVKGYVKTK